MRHTIATISRMRQIFHPKCLNGKSIIECCNLINITYYEVNRLLIVISYQVCVFLVIGIISGDDDTTSPLFETVAEQDICVLFISHDDQ